MEFFRQLLHYRSRFFVYPGAFFLHQYDEDLREFDDCDQITHLELMTPDKITLYCSIYSHDTPHSLCFADQAKGTIILFHGNGMTHKGMFEYISNFYRLGFDVLAAEYRGFGRSTGVPSEQGVRIDAQTMLNYVLADPIRSNRPVVIFGQSLGGAIAIDLTSRNDDKIAALIVENTFTSISDVMKAMRFIRHFRFICSEKWRSASCMARMSHRIPVLLLSATDDNIIPPKHMEKLRDIANERGRKVSKKDPSIVHEDASDRGQVRLELLEDCDHNSSLTHPNYWNYVEDFLKGSLKHWDTSEELFTDSK